MTNQQGRIHFGNLLFRVWLAINFLVVSAVFLIPPWKVTHYEQWSEMDKMIQHDRRGDSIGTWGPLQWAPVWHPPGSFRPNTWHETGKAVESPVRWPWVRAQPGYYAEFDHTRITAMLSVWVILNSFFAACFAAGSRFGHFKKLSRILIPLGGGQLIGWFGFLMIGAVSMGFGWQPVTFYGSLGAGLGASLVLMLIRSSRSARPETGTALHDNSPARSETLIVGDAEKPSEKRTLPLQTIATFFGFCLSIPVSFFLFAAVTQIGKPFMGRSIGGGPYGSREEHEFLVNYVSGIALLLFGCFLGWWLAKKSWTRGFGFGLICCSIVTGVLKFIQH